MLFNSLHFLVFFPLVTVGYYLLPHRHRWWWLLGASSYFYMVFKPVYILILLFTIIIDYYAGIFIERANEEGDSAKARLFLTTSLVANIGILAIFKYFNFLNGNLDWLLGNAGMENPIPYLDILLPIGLSFHTFQAMSYTIEVYRGVQKAEYHFGIYALYVMFYPQLVAGPIERPQNVLHQFHQPITYQEENIISGLKMMLWGLFKKVVVADRAAVLVNAVYADPSSQSGLANLLAALFFSIQIYGDFSGYSDMALGSAKAMGFHLMKNFERPYFSQSLGEFWRRWHISLSTWFKDYLYIPLGGSKVPFWKEIRNLFMVFTISGIWHGANWTFVVWGAIHGVGVAVERIFRDTSIKIPNSNAFFKGIRILLTFLLVTIAWVYFRAETFAKANEVFRAIFTDLRFSFTDFKNAIFLFTMDNTAAAHFVVVSLGILFMFWVEIRSNPVVKEPFAGTKFQALFWVVVMAWVLFFGYFRGSSFIYFQF